MRPAAAAPRFRGRLITTTFVATALAEAGATNEAPPMFGRMLTAWNRDRTARVGPASGVRALADVVLLPLVRLLAFTVEARTDTADRCHLRLQAGHGRLTGLVVSWSTPLDRAWRDCVVAAADDAAAWAFCCNGRSLRVVHAAAPWSRDHLELDLDVVGEHEETQRFVWGALGAGAFARTPPALERAAALSARQGVAVCQALGSGVLTALAALVEAIPARGGASPLDTALTMLYRILFLLFAEARGLVPVWHPIYRDRYTVSSLVTTLLAGGRCRGVWDTVQAITRLVHGGCTAGDLRVTAFNGGLFALPDAAVERTRVYDGVMQRVVMALGSASVAGRRLRIAYADLDVEQLGSVYERILDHDAGAADGRPGARGDERQASGTFYTPRALTAALVRSALAPLVAQRTSDEILALRVLDPAMGSGAFLVAACRYLAAAVEDARIREGTWHAADVTAGERAALRREVAQRCLYGVDLNPIAVQVARLSLWLATLAADKPLSFLDHRLLAGNSLVGATPDDLGRVPQRRRTEPRLPLFDSCPLTPALEHAVAQRLQCATEADDTVAIVRRKERTLARLREAGTAITRWQHVLDLWCGRWFRDGRPPTRAAFDDMARHLLGQPAALPARALVGLLDESTRTAARERFVHWPLVFPEVFADTDGSARANPGFDAVIGNPPWDMVRGDSGERDVRADRRRAARRLTAFVRESGVYQVTPRGHVNRYQLFVERALRLTRRGGRLGLILPAGVLSDASAAPLRRHLFDRTGVDVLIGIDNRRGLFPIHRSLRFVLLTATAGEPTVAIRCRFRVDGVEALESPASPGPIVVSRRLLERLSGDDLAVPQLPDADALRLVERLSSRHPALGAAAGWHVHFGRELNATDDRAAFLPARPGTTHRPVLEGKQIEPFRAHPERAAWLLPAASRAAARVRERPRLAYRDVAAAGNRLTLIAALVPARCVTTHTLFCLKEALPPVEQEVLCGLLNSFVANYLVRLTVNTHVTTAHLARLPVPRPAWSDGCFQALAALSRTLSRAPAPAESAPEYVELQAWAARAYGVTRAELQHVLSTFPLIDPAVRARVLERWSALEPDAVS